MKASRSGAVSLFIFSFKIDSKLKEVVMELSPFIFPFKIDLNGKEIVLELAPFISA